MSDMVYLLSMTYNNLSDTEDECVWLRDDADVLVPTRCMGEAMPFDTEFAAATFHSAQGFGLAYQVTPIDAKRFFKAKLKGRT